MGFCGTDTGHGIISEVIARGPDPPQDSFNLSIA